MVSLELIGVEKKYGTVPALRGMELQVKPGECFVILGPTGAGKTTALRCVAGLEALDQGSIRFDGEDVSGLPPAARDVAFIFQQYSLYPRYTVFENIAFPLQSQSRRKVLPAEEIKRRVTAVAEKLHIAHLLERRTNALAGGEMQRVAIGRAIVRRPRAFLMDEPLSSLDAKLREGLRSELRALQRSSGVTTLYVTHDQTEALSLADRVGVMRNGKLEQAGTPQEIYDRPVNTFVASFLGAPAINLFPLEVKENILTAAGGAFRLEPLPGQRAAIADRELVFWGVRPEDVRLRKDPEKSAVRGRISMMERLGAEDIARVDVNGIELRASCSPLDSYQAGENVGIDWVSERFKFFDSIAGKLLA